MKLFTLVITVSTILFAIFPNANTRFSRIVGGVRSDPNEFRYMVSVRWNYRQPSVRNDTHHLCGGCILTESWILTAAHCNLRGNAQGTLEAMAGEVDFDNEQNDNSHKQVRIISNLINHEQYEIYAQKLNPYDIAIGKLDSPFFLNEFVSVINLPVKDSVPTGSVIFCGWGSVSRTNTIIRPRYLQKAELLITDLDQCKAIYGDAVIVDESNVCAGDMSGERAVCIGDSGGPLVQFVDGVLTHVGIASFGAVPCGARNRPGVFTKVSFYIDWIYLKIN